LPIDADLYFQSLSCEVEKRDVSLERILVVPSNSLRMATPRHGGTVLLIEMGQKMSGDVDT